MVMRSAAHPLHSPHLLRPARGKLLQSRKGFFFLLISIMIITLLLLVVASMYRSQLSEKQRVSASRVQAINTLVGDMEAQYLPAAFVSVTQDSLEALTAYAGAYGAQNGGATPFLKGGFQNDLNRSIFDGDIPRLDVDLHDYGLHRSLPEFLDGLTSAVDDIYRVDMHIYVGNMTLGQFDPFWVNMTAQVNYTLRTREGDLFYDRAVNITGRFSIIGLHDPLYSYRSRNMMQRNLFESTFTTNLAPADLQALLSSGNYTRDGKGLSYLERFVGAKDTSLAVCKSCGIFALIDPRAASAADASYADYTFNGWKGKCADRHLYMITGLPANFFLNEHFVDRIFGIDPSMLIEISDLDASPPVNECKDG